MDFAAFAFARFHLIIFSVPCLAFLDQFAGGEKSRTDSPYDGHPQDRYRGGRQQPPGWLYGAQTCRLLLCTTPAGVREGWTQSFTGTITLLLNPFSRNAVRPRDARKRSLLPVRPFPLGLIHPWCGIPRGKVKLFLHQTSRLGSNVVITNEGSLTHI